MLVAAFVATLALLAARSVAIPAMAAPAAATMHTQSHQPLSEDSPSGDQPADDAIDQQGDGAAPTADAGDPSQEAEPGPARYTPSSRGGMRTLDSTPMQSAAQARQAAGNRIAGIAEKYVGAPYRWAGMSPRTGFDCSGLMGYVYQEAGINIPLHSLAGMLGSGDRVTRDELQPGDLVFFENTWERGLSHGGIYIGNGKFVHAETEGIGVVISNLDAGNWISHFVGGSRPY